jgi:N-acetylmuramoyl-L-alanine amidase
LKKHLEQYFLHIMLVLLLSLGVFASFLFGQQAMAQNKTLYWGSTGSDVNKVQYKLRQWGYYNGPVDGVYGAKTSQAVRSFQLRNGLNPDGVVGNNTWERLGYQVRGTAWGAPRQEENRAQDANVERWSPESNARTRETNQTYLLAKVIAGEARGEPYLGKVAVGAVMMNRVQSSAFPNTLAGVIYQPMAFESVSNGQYARPVDEESLKAARQVMNGWDPTNGALFFWNPSKRVSPWIWSRNITMRIGKHVFGI